MNARGYMTYRCYECGCDLYYGQSVRCVDCSRLLARVISRARRAMLAAMRKGELVNLKTEVVACVDCGKRSDRYDHRDYLRPVDVVPVCWHCNRARGPAAPCLASLGLLKEAA